MELVTRLENLMTDLAAVEARLGLPNWAYNPKELTNLESRFRILNNKIGIIKKHLIELDVQYD